MKKLLNSIRTHQADVSVLLFLAAGIVGLFSHAMHPMDQGDEMMRLAGNIVEHGTYANPFAILATGPTAANPPLYPLILAGLWKILRVKPLVETAAVVGSILANAITAALLPRVSVEFYRDAVPGVIAAILWLPVMPMMAGWDTSFTLVGLLAFCTVAVAPTAEARDAIRRAALRGAVAGLLFLLNPSSLLVSLPMLGYSLQVARTDCRHAVRYLSVFFAVLCLFIAGWGVRNYQQLGAFVVRTNLGMTLYASNNDCAESSMFGNHMNGCYQTHHPNASLAEAELLRSLGEVRYDRMRIGTTRDWVQANSARFLKLTFVRIREFWFPALEILPESSVFPDSLRNLVKQQNGVTYVIWSITGLSIPGFILMTVRRVPVTIYVLVVLALYPLMYYVVVSDMRYRYPVLWLSLLPAGYFIAALVEGTLERTRQTVAPDLRR
jgi:hypothetical protein